MQSRRLLLATGALACAVVVSAAATAMAGAAGAQRSAGPALVNGGVIDASPRARAQAAAGPMTLVPLGNPITLDDGTKVNVSNDLTFTWTNDTVSVMVYAEPRPGGTVKTIVQGPAGQRPDRTNEWGPTGGFIVPGSDLPAPSGVYRYAVAGSEDANAAEVVVVQRRGPQPTSGGTLDINFFVLEGSGLDQPTLQAAVNKVAETYAQAKVRLGSLTLYNVTGADDFNSISSDTSTSDAGLRQLVTLSGQARNAQAVNIFFVRSLELEGGGTLFGIAVGGIPGALSIPGTIASGVVVNVSAHDTDGGFDVSNFAQTIAHENGHNMGLRHTSERSGDDHDPISDTAECFGDAAQDAAACPDGQNLMFWAGVGFQVSAGQSYVLVRTPIVH